MKCKFNDCGWCYCQSGKSNDDCGQCNHHESCEEYPIQSDETKSLSVILGCINVMADDCLPSRTMVVSRDIFESVKKERSHD